LRNRLLALGLLLLGCASPAFAQNDAERVRAAKALTLDRKYAEARQAWTAILGSAQGTDADAAAYWIARSSEKLGERERAFKEYGTFLARRSSDRGLVDEARTSRIGLAAQLYRAGQASYVNVLHEGLTDANKTVRYFAALQLGGLGAPTSKRAVPVLKEILAKETDDDLLDRSRIILLRLEPTALSGPSAALAEPARPAGPPVAAKWLRLRVFEKGRSTPEVSINVPVALADILFESLPDEAKGELKKKGYDAENFWRKLKQLGPSEIVEIKGEDGSVVKVWLE
jgi:HEAT repeat protein